MKFKVGDIIKNPKRNFVREIISIDRFEYELRDIYTNKITISSVRAIDHYNVLMHDNPHTTNNNPSNDATNKRKCECTHSFLHSFHGCKCGGV